MTRFVLGATLGSARQGLAIVVAVAAVGCAVYLGSHPLERSYGACARQPQLTMNIVVCEQTTRAAWQIPLAVGLGLVGVGSAGVIVGRRRPERRIPSDGRSYGRLARI